VSLSDLNPIQSALILMFYTVPMRIRRLLRTRAERRGGRTAFPARRGKEEKSASPERAKSTPGKSTRPEREVAGREDKHCILFVFAIKMFLSCIQNVMIDDITHVIKINGGIINSRGIYLARHKLLFITEYFQLSGVHIDNKILSRGGSVGVMSPQSANLSS
jgi:hypothetical protein